MRWAKAAGILLAALPAGAFARDYDCAAWQPAGTGQPEITRISLVQSMIAVPVGGASETIRMVRSSLERRVYLDDASVWVVHAGPEPKARVTVQRILHDETQPAVLRTTCQARD